MKVNKFQIQQIIVFAMTFFGYSMLHAMRSSWSYSKKIIQKEDFINNSKLGFIDFTFMICYSFGLAFIGPLGDKFNRRKFISFGYYTCATAYLVFPVVYKLFGWTNWVILLIFMGINGLGESVGMPGSMGVLSKWFGKQKRGMLIGFWAGCCNYGNIFGLIASTIISHSLDYSWQWNFYFCGVLTLCMATIILIFLKPQPQTQKQSDNLVETMISNDIQNKEKQQKTQSIGVIAALKIPRVINYIIAYSCLKSSIYGLLFWLPKYIAEQGMASQSGYIPVMNQVGTFFGGIVIGSLGDKYPRSYFLSPVMLISCSMMLIAKYVLSNHPLPYYFVILLMGFGLGGPYNVIGTVIAIDLGSQDELKGNKKAIATVTAIIDSVGAFFSAFTQILLGQLNPDIIFLLFAIYTAIGAFSLMPLMIKDYKLAINLEDAKDNQQILTNTEEIN